MKLPLELTLDLRDLVAVSTTVNCSRLQDQIANVRITRSGSDIIFSSLKESKNSIMSAAVPKMTFLNYFQANFISRFACMIELADVDEK